MTATVPQSRAPVALHALGGLILAGWTALALGSRQPGAHLGAYLAANVWTWLGFLAALVLCWRRGSGVLVRPLLLWGIAFRLAGLLATPVMEDDYYRVLWDGRQLALTGNPYATAPAAHFADESVPERFREILDHVNYPHVPTLYGPICQGGFALSYWIAPGQLWPWKLLLFCVDVAALLLMFKLTVATRAALPAGPAGSEAARALPVLIFGWCPLAVFESSFNAHPDLLGVTLMLGALVCWRNKVLRGCAVFCGLAVAAKVFAWLLVPFLLGRKATAWAVFAGVLAACYAPFWMQGTLADWGGLRAFAAEWEFNSSVYAVARGLLGPAPARWVCALAFGVIWCVLLGRWVARGEGVQGGVFPPGAFVFGAFLALSATVNPWYLLWFLPFVALKPTFAGVTALAAVSLSYVTGLNLGHPGLDNFAHPAWVRPVEYGVVALAGAADAWIAVRRCAGKK